MAYTPKLTFKGKPLVRCGRELYYGSLQDNYFVALQILTFREENGHKLADKVHVALMSTDNSKSLPERIVRQSNKDGLYNALTIGDIWLKQAQNNEAQ